MFAVPDGLPQADLQPLILGGRVTGVCMLVRLFSRLLSLSTFLFSAALALQPRRPLTLSASQKLVSLLQRSVFCVTSLLSCSS